MGPKGVNTIKKVWKRRKAQLSLQIDSEVKSVRIGKHHQNSILSFSSSSSSYTQFVCPKISPPKGPWT
ncbi:hypothetical protein QVD17_13249 [Tagetes erecta]|uniref:Uncharacterized protein n=1 Tax=Tagetes erecta TaxID=13708 RepID=A0AAD8KWV0_TARER|nr:hypothetical protein QVD17_13249 [Tagetes erecta]